MKHGAVAGAGRVDQPSDNQCPSAPKKEDEGGDKEQRREEEHRDPG
jgi:hypothetical protein